MSFRHFLAPRLRFGAVSPGKRVPQTLELLNTTPVRATEGHGDFSQGRWGMLVKERGFKSKIYGLWCQNPVDEE